MAACCSDARPRVTGEDARECAARKPRGDCGRARAEGVLCVHRHRELRAHAEQRGRLQVSRRPNSRHDESAGCNASPVGGIPDGLPGIADCIMIAPGTARCFVSGTRTATVGSPTASSCKSCARRARRGGGVAEMRISTHLGMHLGVYSTRLGMYLSTSGVHLGMRCVGSRAAGEGVQRAEGAGDVWARRSR